MAKLKPGGPARELDPVLQYVVSFLPTPSISRCDVIYFWRSCKDLRPSCLGTNGSDGMARGATPTKVFGFDNHFSPSQVPALLISIKIVH